MKKINGTKVCNILSVVLFLCFIIKTVVDYVRYSQVLTSAPFYVWILVNAIYFIVPSIIAFLVGVIIKIITKTDKQCIR